MIIFTVFVLLKYYYIKMVLVVLNDLVYFNIFKLNNSIFMGLSLSVGLKFYLYFGCD